MFFAISPEIVNALSVFVEFCSISHTRLHTPLSNENKTTSESRLFETQIFGKALKASGTYFIGKFFVFGNKFGEIYSLRPDAELAGELSRIGSLINLIRVKLS